MVVKPLDASSMDESLKKLNLSSKELGNFEKAFKDPEFIKLFDDYVKEVSDPKVKAETEQYLRQLEAEGQVEQVYGKGVQLLTPAAAFAIKTRNLRNGSTAFINFCSCDKVAELQQRRATKPDGSSGLLLETPFHLGHAKQLKSKEGEAQLAWDVVLHPKTVAAALGSSSVLGVVVESVMEKIEGTGDFKLHRGFKPVKAKYKGDGPVVMAIRTGEGGEVVNGRLRPATSAAPGSDLTGDQQAKAAAEKRSAFSFGPKPKAAEAKRSAAATGTTPALPPQPKSPASPGCAHALGEVTPSWQLVHRGEVDLAQAWGDAGRAIPMAGTVPKELVVRVSLPGVGTAADIDLDVVAQQLRLSVPGRYLLQLQLPHEVDEARSRARFNREAQQLQLTLPVVAQQPERAPLAVVAAAKQGAAPEAGGAAPEAGGAAPEAGGAPEGAPPVAVGSGSSGAGRCSCDAAGEGPAACSSAEPQLDQDAAVCSNHSASTGDPGQPSSAGEEADAGGARQLTDNERKWLELHQKGSGMDRQAEGGSIRESGTGSVVQARVCGTPATAEEGVTEPTCTSLAATAEEGVTEPTCTIRLAAVHQSTSTPAPVLRPRLRSTLAHDLL